MRSVAGHSENEIMDKGQDESSIVSLSAAKPSTIWERISSGSNTTTILYIFGASLGVIGLIAAVLSFVIAGSAEDGVSSSNGKVEAPDESIPASFQLPVQQLVGRNVPPTTSSSPQGFRQNAKAATTIRTRGNIYKKGTTAKVSADFRTITKPDIKESTIATSHSKMSVRMRGRIVKKSPSHKGVEREITSILQTLPHENVFNSTPEKSSVPYLPSSLRPSSISNTAPISEPGSVASLVLNQVSTPISTSVSSPLSSSAYDPARSSLSSPASSAVSNAVSNSASRTLHSSVDISSVSSTAPTLLSNESSVLPRRLRPLQTPEFRAKLFCVYDDRSAIRSPGFTVYDIPAQLCTDVAYCCIGVDNSGQLNLDDRSRMFLRVVRSESPSNSRLYLVLGGHQLLITNLDAALKDTAYFANRLVDGIDEAGADGIAIYLEDLEVLQRANRVHDLILSIRDIFVVVILPKDLRQQVRYYRTEMYSRINNVIVILPPSQSFKDTHPTYTTCLQPRRSQQRLDASLEFVYQLSKTLLSSAVDPDEDEEADVSNSPLVGLSFEGLKFRLKNGSSHDVGSPATFLRTVPYREVCKKSSWKIWHDAFSECVVFWDGGRKWMASLSTSGSFVTERLGQGLAVFDIDYDDFSGDCGGKFPLLRALRAALAAGASSAVLNALKESGYA